LGYSHGKKNDCRQTYLAILTPPNKISLSPTPRELIQFLQDANINQPMLKVPFTMYSNSDSDTRKKRKRKEQERKADKIRGKRSYEATYKPANADPIRMNISTGSTLHFECVIVLVLWSVVWAEVCDAVLFPSAVELHKLVCTGELKD
jgi:hypothetical protein